MENKSHGLGEETNFEFKHIPSLSKMTEELGEYEDTGLKGGVERRNLITFTFGTAFLGFLGYLASRVALGAIGELRSWLISG